MKWYKEAEDKFLFFKFHIQMYKPKKPPCLCQAWAIREISIKSAATIKMICCRLCWYILSLTVFFYKYNLNCGQKCFELAKQISQSLQNVYLNLNLCIRSAHALVIFSYKIIMQNLTQNLLKLLVASKHESCR